MRRMGKTQHDSDSMIVEVACSLCGCTEFREYNTRPAAACKNCRSLERTRLLWLVMERLDLLQPGMRILHWAPEEPLAIRLSALPDVDYTACDIDTEKYRKFPVPVISLDMCVDLPELEDARFDLIIHNHVLEHIPCNVANTLEHLRRILKPGGHQLFSVPFRGEHTDEDLDPGLSDAERTRRFGQSDHMRIFGRADFIPLVNNAYGSANIRYDLNELMTAEDVAAAAVPARVLNGLTGETIFRHKRPTELN